MDQGKRNLSHRACARPLDCLSVGRTPEHHDRAPDPNHPRRPPAAIFGACSAANAAAVSRRGAAHGELCFGPLEVAYDYEVVRSLISREGIQTAREDRGAIARCCPSRVSRSSIRTRASPRWSAQKISAGRSAYAAGGSRMTRSIRHSRSRIVRYRSRPRGRSSWVTRCWPAPRTAIWPVPRRARRQGGHASVRLHSGRSRASQDHRRVDLRADAARSVEPRGARTNMSTRALITSESPAADRTAARKLGVPAGSASVRPGWTVSSRLQPAAPAASRPGHQVGRRQAVARLGVHRDRHRHRRGRSAPRRPASRSTGASWPSA